MDNKVNELIGSRIGIARTQAGLTQAQVAKELNVPRPSISEIEAGRRKVSVEELRKMSDLFEVEMTWLAGQGEIEANPIRDKLQLAARNVADLSAEDLNKVIFLLESLKKGPTK